MCLSDAPASIKKGGQDMGFEYTVNGKDKGLSHIFLEAAKKKGGFNFAKKIDWNKVMSVFAQVQKEEQAEGQKLFSGSADYNNADWSKSFVLKPGDKISLSQGQLDRIFTAMGLELSNTNTAQTANTAANLVNSDDVDPKSGLLSKVQLDNYMIIPHKEFANRSIHNPDGTTYTYNNAGFVEEVFDKNGNMTREIARDQDGSVVLFYEKEYDKSGNMTREVTRNSDGSVSGYSDREYDENGNLTYDITHDSNGNVINYYENYREEELV